MGQVNLTFSNKNIDPSDHILSVFIEADSFVYGIFDSQHQLVASSHHKLGLNTDRPLDAVGKDTNIHSNYKKTIITYSSKEYVHLGKLDFEAGDFEVYFDDTTINQELLTDKFTDSDVHVVFSVDNKLRQKINEILSPNEEIHVSTAMRQYIYPSQMSKNVCMLTDNKLHFMSYAKGDLKVYNSFDFRSKEDVLYYLQLVSDFAEVDKENDSLELGGWIDESSEMYKVVRPYFRNIDWVNLPYMSLASSDRNHTKHHFFALYASALCVL